MVSKNDFIKKINDICGISDVKEVSDMLGKSFGEVLSDIRSNRIIAIGDGKNLKIPNFQFKEGRVIEGLDRVLNSFDNASPEMKCSLFLNPLYPNSNTLFYEHLANGDISVEMACFEAHKIGKMGF